MNNIEQIPKKFTIQVHLQAETQEEAILNMKDSVFTYFGVPTRLSDPSLLKAGDELNLELATN